MNKKENSKKYILPLVILVCILALFSASVIRTDSYNKKTFTETFSGPTFFSSEKNRNKPVSVNAVARGSTWTKLFDLNNEGLTEHNYQAFTYDFPVSNNSDDIVSRFTFKLAFDKQVFLLSAWNGALEIHQIRGDDEIVNTVPDLRDYVADDYNLDIVTFDGEVLVRMNPGDYLVYYPSSTENAMEVPIDPHEGTVPGIILYTAIGEDIEGSILSLEYGFSRSLQSDPIYWASMLAIVIWIITILNILATSAQIKRYKDRHKRDNEIINEAIETFTGFIDAKDRYTNGHSKRVAEYTRLIAKETGIEGEELDKIYYIALLHDCGKIGVPDNILGKPGKLTDEEFEVIKSHTVRGGEILRSFKSLPDVEKGALYHHERYDGRGYPEGKAAEDIPLIARMICVADAFDAMNSNRVYRNKLSKENILSEIESNKGKQFDPRIADIFLRLIAEGKIPLA